MPDLLDRIQSELHARLEETRAAAREYEQLEAALHALTGDRPPEPRSDTARQRRRAPQTSRTTGASPATGPGRTAAPKRAAHGANRDAVLRALSEGPGASISELAAASGVPKAVLYTVLRRLVAAGEAQKRALPSGRTRYALVNTGATADGSPGETEAAAASTREPSPATAPRPATARSARRN
jgi:hypothetical protein